MCRMLAMTGDFSSVFPGIMKAFSEVTRKDPLADKDKDRSESHSDGWGFVFSGNSNIRYEKHYLPFYNDKIPEFGSGSILIHARQAAPGEPMGVSRNHPFYATDGKYDIFLCHNGWFDKGAISRDISLKDPENYVDSEVFLKYAMKFHGTDMEKISASLETAFRENMVKSSANILALSINRMTRSRKILYYTDVSMAREYDEYYKLYIAEGSQWKGIFSSSIIRSMHFPEDCKITEVPRAMLLSINAE